MLAVLLGARYDLFNSKALITAVGDRVEESLPYQVVCSTASNTNDSSQPFYRDCMKLLKKFINSVSDNPRLLESLASFGWSAFVIIRLQSLDNRISAISTLDTSAELCGVELNFDVPKITEPKMMLQYLSQKCPTIWVKDLYKHRVTPTAITPAQVLFKLP
jgi:hypothetical protein